MAKINFGGTEEEVITSDEFSLERASEVLKDETVAVLGYGVQGPGQALNMRDNGINVIVGQREKSIPGTVPSKTASFPAKPSSPWRKPPKKGPLSSFCFQTPARWPRGRT